MEAEELKKVIKESMSETLEHYGFKTEEPHEMRKDFTHMRNSRLGCEATKRHIWKAFITVTVPGAVYVLWDALKGAK